MIYHRNPSRKLQIIIFNEIALNGILEIIDTPFVSSTIPEKSPFTKLKGIFNLFNIGEKTIPSMSKTLVLFKIEIITLKRTTNPPIIMTVAIELIILL